MYHYLANLYPKVKNINKTIVENTIPFNSHCKYKTYVKLTDSFRKSNFNLKVVLREVQQRHSNRNIKEKT